MEKTTYRKEKKRQIKMEQVFSVALEIFGKYGYKKSTLEDIAGELNMTKSGLYRYFKDKRDLYEQAVSFGLKKWQQTSVGAIIGDDDPCSQVTQYAIAGMTYLEKDVNFRNVLLNDPAIFPLNTKEDQFASINQESMNILKDILKRGIEAGRFRNVDIDYTVSFMYSVYVMFIIRSYVKSDIDLGGNTIHNALDILLHGIVKE